MASRLKRLMDRDDAPIDVLKAIKDLLADIEAQNEFIELDDTPSSYTGEAGKIVTVNSAEDALEFTTVIAAGVEDDVYGPGWNDDIINAPTQNAVYDYTVLQHNRKLHPSSFFPNSFNFNPASVAHVGGVIFHGKNSKSSGNFCIALFRLPIDYVSGQDITFSIRVEVDGAVGDDVVDYSIEFYRLSDGSQSLEQTTASTWTVPVNGNRYDITVTGVNFLPREDVEVVMYMEDDDNVESTINWGVSLLIPANSRD